MTFQSRIKVFFLNRWDDLKDWRNIPRDETTALCIAIALVGIMICMGI